MRVREPLATYRIQLGGAMDFAGVARVVQHIAALGVSHLYLSPIGAATKGSTHGYDWVPPARVSEILGGIDGLHALRRTASAHGLGIIVDIVPNHTGVADVRQNPWFEDLLRHGRASRFADWFDVDYATDNGAEGRIALPVLGSEADLDALTVDAGWLRVHDRAFPIAPGTGGGTAKSVHARQHYRLVAFDSGLIGYRRFFTVNDLAGLRQENPEVYRATHEWLFELARADLIDGVRVDHIDGLADPVGYLTQLRADLGSRHLIYVEKILATDEALDPVLPVSGTTGYDQLRMIDAVFTSPSGLIELGEIHHRITGVEGDRRQLVAAEHDRKLVTLADDFRAEHRRLVRTLTHADPSADEQDIASATAELIAELGVYRTDYPSLRERLVQTTIRIGDRMPRLRPALHRIVTATALPGPASVRLSQTCGAVTAKSVEDSLFYRTARLVSAQEVGGSPAHATVELQEFHAHNACRAHDWPLAMTASSTHDTKRGEDVRARIALLSQIPERWWRFVDEIRSAEPFPDDLSCYFLLQNIIGVWPIDAPTDHEVPTQLRTRLRDYARKAMREAGLRTAWTRVDDNFERSLADWIDRVTSYPCAALIDALTAEIAVPWRAEALARKAITLLGPGVGDIYQGTQWWEDSLVDPDNRRPVDMSQSSDHPKHQLIRAALRVRADHHEAFGSRGSYAALPVEGHSAAHTIAFVRSVRSNGTGTDDPRVVVVTARFTHSLTTDDQAATRVSLPDGQWCDALSQTVHAETVDLATLRSTSPVAILTSGSAIVTQPAGAGAG